MTESGRCALVTGAARGIGAAIAERLVVDGWSVHAVDLEDGEARHRRHLLEAGVRDDGVALCPAYTRTGLVERQLEGRGSTTCWSRRR